MEIKFLSKIIPITLLFIFVISLIYSCENKKKDYNNFFIQEPAQDVKSTIDFNSLISLNESNKKIMEISSILFHQNKPIPNLSLILKIREDHRKNELNLKVLTKRNLIIMPKPIYNLNINSDSLQNKNSTHYLAKLLINEIKTQIELLEKIKNTTISPDFKTYAEEAKIMFDNNNEGLKTSFNL
ncbi:hypothetical protein [Flavobacterium ovatum]|uniref:hypothetical protein n=1 Tax=Flavobacterium ovatum TaxID=1928857 RepID=UPI00344FA2D9